MWPDQHAIWPDFCYPQISMLVNTFLDTAEWIGVKRSSPSGRAVDVKRHPIHFSSVERLGKHLRVDASTLLDLMGIPQRTRSRRRHDGILKADEADRLLRIARIFGEAVRILGSEDKAQHWLKASSPLFEGASPLSYLDSDGGAHAVGEELVRIDFGDFA
jgi:putative toxin-antitoxin system antitoxin component (TIGR02293 family)